MVDLKKDIAIGKRSGLGVTDESRYISTTKRLLLADLDIVHLCFSFGQVVVLLVILASDILFAIYSSIGYIVFIV